MIQQLFVIFLICGQISGEESSLELELKCPQGWLVQGMTQYSRSTQTIILPVAPCLLCSWNSILHHPFKYIEFCWMHQGEAIIFNSNMSITKIIVQDDLLTEPFCSVKLSVDQKAYKDVIVNELSKCQNNQFIVKLENETDLICPNYFQLDSLITKTVIHNKGGNHIQDATTCIVCLHKDKSSVIICPFRNYFWSNTNNLRFITSKLQQCTNKDATKCEAHKIPEIITNDQCGSRFVHSPESSTVSKHILCKEVNIDASALNNDTQLDCQVQHGFTSSFNI